MPASYTIREDLHLELYGISGVAENQDWANTGMALMNKMWQEVKSRGLKNKGINVWVYEAGNKMYAGVELTEPPPGDTSLELKKLHLPKYVHYKHIGSYDKIKTSFSRLSEELQRDGIETGLPYLEIYGHWTEDETKLETEMLWCLKNN